MDELRQGRAAPPYAEMVPLAGEGAMARLVGPHDENLEAVEARYTVSLSVREGAVRASGPDEEPVRIVARLLRELAAVAESGHEVRAADVRRAMDALSLPPLSLAIPTRNVRYGFGLFSPCCAHSL